MSVDVLNRFPNSSNLADTVHVMKYIFPRQFGLHNVFTSVVDSRETVQPFKDYTLREEEIARSKIAQRSRIQPVRPKIPKRLRGGPLQLVQRLQKRSQTCSYTELLRHYCPISVSYAFFDGHLKRWLIITGNWACTIWSHAILSTKE